MTRRLRSYLLALAYHDGVGEAHVGAVDLYANCLLLDCGVRPAFMVQPVDYSGTDLASCIVENMEDGGYEVDKTHQGYVVFTPRMSSKIRPLVSRYNRNHSDELMGHILGYPAWDDFPGEDRSKSRLVFDWLVELEGYNGEHQVMVNVFRDKSLVPEMEDLAVKMADCLEPKGFKVYTKLRRIR